MQEFKTIYHILKALLLAMETGELDKDRISSDTLNVSENKRRELIILLAEEGYIKGLLHKWYIDGGVAYQDDDIKITLKGIEYLEDNSMMKKAANLAKGVIDMVL